jgi:hypothetical protein
LDIFKLKLLILLFLHLLVVFLCNLLAHEQSLFSFHLHSRFVGLLTTYVLVQKLLRYFDSTGLHNLFSLLPIVFIHVKFSGCIHTSCIKLVDFLMDQFSLLLLSDTHLSFLLLLNLFGLLDSLCDDPLLVFLKVLEVFLDNFIPLFLGWI